MKVSSLITGYGLEAGTIYEAYSISPRGDCYFIFSGEDFKKDSIRFPGTNLYGKHQFNIVEGTENDFGKLKFINIYALTQLIIYNYSLFKFNNDSLFNSIEKILNINFNKIIDDFEVGSKTKEDFLNKLFNYIVDNYGEQSFIQIIIDIFDYSIFNNNILDKISINGYRNNIKGMIYKGLFLNDIINKNIEDKELLEASGVDIKNIENINITKLAKYFSNGLPNSIKLEISKFVQLLNKNSTGNKDRGLDYGDNDNKFLFNHISNNKVCYFTYKNLFEELLSKETKFTILLKILNIFELPYSFIKTIDYSNDLYKNKNDQLITNGDEIDYIELANIIFGKRPFLTNSIFDKLYNLFVITLGENEDIFYTWFNRDELFVDKIIGYLRYKNFVKDTKSLKFFINLFNFLINEDFYKPYYSKNKEVIGRVINEVLLKLKTITGNNIIFDEKLKSFRSIDQNILLNINEEVIKNIIISKEQIIKLSSYIGNNIKDKNLFNEGLKKFNSFGYHDDEEINFVKRISRGDNDFYFQVLDTINQEVNEGSIEKLDFICFLNYIGIDFNIIGINKEYLFIENKKSNIDIGQIKIDKYNYNTNISLINKQNLMENTIVLSNEEILKRVDKQNITLEKVNLNNNLVKSYLKGSIDGEGLEDYFNKKIHNKEIFTNIKKYLKFYLYSKKINQEEENNNNYEFEDELCIVFDSMLFGNNSGSNAVELTQYIEIINNYNYNDENFENLYNNEDLKHRNLIEINLFEGKDETKILQNLVKSLSLITYEDVKNKFEIGDNVKFQKYKGGDVYFGAITLRKFDMYKKEWNYSISGNDYLIEEEKISII